MTFERPGALLLLLAVPALVWLHRRLAAPRERLISSVAPLRAARATESAARPRRRLDGDLICLLTAVVALALAATSPLLGAARPTVLVVVDRSASMYAAADGETLLHHAARRLVASLAETGDGEDAALDVVMLDDPDAPRQRLGVAGDLAGWSAELPSSVVPDGLPDTVLAVLPAARALGFPQVVLLTDRAVDVPGVLVSGPGVAATTSDAAVLGAVLDGDAAIVRVVPLRATVVVVRATNGDGSIPPGAAAATVAAADDGLPVEVRLVAPEPGGVMRYSVSPGGALSSNDVLEVRRLGGVRTARVRGDAGPDEAALRALLPVLGVAIVEGALDTADVDVRVGGPPRPRAVGAPPVLHLAATAGESPQVAVEGDPALVRGARIVATGVLSVCVPDPSATIAITGRIVGATGVSGSWQTLAGVVAVVRDDRVVTTARPVGEGAWLRDASFPVFVIRALESLSGGADRLEPVAGVLPEAPAARGREPTPQAAPDDVARAIRPASSDPRTTRLDGWLAWCGVVALLGVVATGWRRRSAR